LRPNSEDITDLDPDSVIVDDVAASRKPKRTRGRDAEWIFGLFGLLVGAGGLVAGRIGHIWAAFDVFAQFGLQFMVVAVSFALGLLLTRLKGSFGLAASVFGLLAIGIWPHIATTTYTSEPINLEPGETAVRLAHFNVLQPNKEYQAIEDELRRLDADVVTLVEMSASKLKILKSLKNTYPYQFECAGVTHCHFAIISKHPLNALEAQGAEQGVGFISASFPTLGNLTVVGTHLTRFPYSRHQLRQATTLVKKLKGSNSALALMGDFNATPFSRIHQVISEGLNVNRLTLLPTWPSTLELPQLAIDHIFVSRKIRMVSGQEIGNAAGSDHYPIAITVAVKK
jgi:endonuclease/exonuclease/phosphatase (EEP) superfamily protein YafD